MFICNQLWIPFAYSQCQVIILRRTNQLQSLDYDIKPTCKPELDAGRKPAVLSTTITSFCIILASQHHFRPSWILIKLCTGNVS